MQKISESIVLQNRKIILPVVGGIALLVLSLCIIYSYINAFLTADGWYVHWIYLIPLFLAIFLGIPIGVTLIIKKRFPKIPVQIKFVIVALLIISAITWCISSSITHIDILNHCNQAPTPKLNCTEIKTEIALTILLTLAVCIVSGGFFFLNTNKQKKPDSVKYK